MADQEKRTLLERLNGRGDMGPVLRVAGWGLAAAAALAIAVFASRSEIGQRRAAVAMNPLQNEAMRLAAAQAMARAEEADREVRRLVETVQTLGTDRDKLLNRVASLERSLEDLTGSIALTQPARRPAMVDLMATPGSRLGAAPPQQDPTPATGSVADQASLGQPPPRIDPPTSLEPDDAEEAGAAPVPGGVPLPRADPRRPGAASRAPAPSPVAPSLIAAGEPQAPDAPPSARAPGQAAPAASSTTLGSPGKSHGIDLGSATSVEGLRALWKNIRHGQAVPLLSDLKPVVSVRDAAQPGSVELRLVAGPVPSALAASRLCAALSAAGTPCRATTFDGQSLAAR